VCSRLVCVNAAKKNEKVEFKKKDNLADNLVVGKRSGEKYEAAKLEENIVKGTRRQFTTRVIFSFPKFNFNEPIFKGHNKNLCLIPYPLKKSNTTIIRHTHKSIKEELDVRALNGILECEKAVTTQSERKIIIREPQHTFKELERINFLTNQIPISSQNVVNREQQIPDNIKNLDTSKEHCKSAKA